MKLILGFYDMEAKVIQLILPDDIGLRDRQRALPLTLA